MCRYKPEIFINAARNAEVGPLQALIDELEFNDHTAKHALPENLGCTFLDEQFRRAIREGSIALLQEELKRTIIEAYRAMGRANQLIPQALSQGRTSILYSEYMGWAREAITHAKPKIEDARNALLKFLSSEEAV